MHTVIETHAFRKAADAVGLTEDDRSAIADFISNEPTAGDVIPGTGGARRLRFAGHGKGKSGGYRVITYYAAEDVPVFLLDLYAKNAKIDLSQAERNQLKLVLGKLADEWRTSARSRAKSYLKGK